jgi:hypothetical protein
MTSVHPHHRVPNVCRSYGRPRRRGLGSAPRRSNEIVAANIRPGAEICCRGRDGCLYRYLEFRFNADRIWRRVWLRCLGFSGCILGGRFGGGRKDVRIECSAWIIELRRGGRTIRGCRRLLRGCLLRCLLRHIDGQLMAGRGRFELRQLVDDLLECFVDGFVSDCAVLAALSRTASVPLPSP